MTRILILVACAALCSGCGNPKTAELRYVQLFPVAKRFAVEFYSDKNFEALYSKDAQIISRRFICALGGDRNFDVKHKIQYVFRGNFELHASPRDAELNSYRYLSHGNFYEYPPDSNDYKILDGNLLSDVMGKEGSIPCKVIMTVYLQAPYYSDEMSIPKRDVIRAFMARK